LERGVGLAMLGRNDEALACFDRGVALAPALARAHDYRGVCLTRMNRAAEALPSFERALEIAPGDGSVLKHKGGAMSVLGRWDEAAALFRAALAADAELVECHELIADAERRLRGEADAPPDGDGHLALFDEGNALLDGGHVADAAERFGAAVKHAPRFAAGWSNLAYSRCVSAA